MKPTSAAAGERPSPPPPSPELREAEVAALLPRGVNAGEAFSLPRRAPCRGGPNPQKRLNPAQNPFTNTTLSSTLKSAVARAAQGGGGRRAAAARRERRRGVLHAARGALGDAHAA